MNESRGRRRAEFAQNLFVSSRPAEKLVRIASIGPGELVYDLGAGTGLVTSALLRAGARVIAVERDPNLVRKMMSRFEGQPATVVEGDLCALAFAPQFKVVSNAPFNRTALLLRRLLSEQPSPASATLTLQREAAARYAGFFGATAVHLAARPWFEFSLTTPFRRRDFVPEPNVDVAVLHIVRRSVPDLGEELRDPWRTFVRYGLARARPDAWRTFRGLVSNLQWRRLSQSLGRAPAVLRRDLSYSDWLAIFRFVLEFSPAGERLLSARTQRPRLLIGRHARLIP